MVLHGRVSGFKGSWDWTQYAAQMAAKPVTLPNLQANTLVYSGRCILTGFNFQNTAGGNGIINLRDGQDNTGEYVGIFPLAASASASGVFGTTGIMMELGVFAEIATATIRGAVYVIPLWHYPGTPPGD